MPLRHVGLSNPVLAGRFLPYTSGLYPFSHTPISPTENQNVPFHLLNQKKFLSKSMVIKHFMIVGNQLQAEQSKLLIVLVPL